MRKRENQVVAIRPDEISSVIREQIDDHQATVSGLGVNTEDVRYDLLARANMVALGYSTMLSARLCQDAVNEARARAYLVAHLDRAQWDLELFENLKLQAPPLELKYQVSVGLMSLGDAMATELYSFRHDGIPNNPSREVMRRYSWLGARIFEREHEGGGGGADLSSALEGMLLAIYRMWLTSRFLLNQFDPRYAEELRAMAIEGVAKFESFVAQLHGPEVAYGLRFPATLPFPELTWDKIGGYRMELIQFVSDESALQTSGIEQAMTQIQGELSEAPPAVGEHRDRLLEALGASKAWMEGVRERVVAIRAEAEKEEAERAAAPATASDLSAQIAAQLAGA